MDLDPCHSITVHREGEAPQIGEDAIRKCRWSTGGGKGRSQCNPFIAKWPTEREQAPRKLLVLRTQWDGKDAALQDGKPRYNALGPSSRALYSWLRLYLTQQMPCVALMEVNTPRSIPFPD